MSLATFVYVISGDHGRQKIGVTDNPPQRLAQLQTGSPFKLRYEFVGLTEGTGFDIEGEAHFLLSRHKSPGGDEWFTVPPEVAITAVMAAARQRGHSIRPVDPDNPPVINRPAFTNPAWARWVTAIFAVPCAGMFVWALVSFDRGRIGVIAAAVCAIVLVWAFRMVSRAAVNSGNALLRFDRYMHPPDGTKVPLYPDRT